MRPGAWVGEGRLVTESQRLGACLAETARELGIDFADMCSLSTGGRSAFVIGLKKTLPFGF